MGYMMRTTVQLYLTELLGHSKSVWFLWRTKGQTLLNKDHNDEVEEEGEEEACEGDEDGMSGVHSGHQRAVHLVGAVPTVLHAVTVGCHRVTLLPILGEDEMTRGHEGVM